MGQVNEWFQLDGLAIVGAKLFPSAFGLPAAGLGAAVALRLGRLADRFDVVHFQFLPVVIELKSWTATTQTCRHQ